MGWELLSPLPGLLCRWGQTGPGVPRGRKGSSWRLLWEGRQKAGPPAALGCLHHIQGGGVESHWPEHKPLGEELMIIMLSGSRGNGLLPRWRMRCLYLKSGGGSSLVFFQEGFGVSGERRASPWAGYPESPLPWQGNLWCRGSSSELALARVVLPGQSLRRAWD